MNSDQNISQMLAFLLIVVGAIVATQLPGLIAPILFMSAIGFLALMLYSLKEETPPPSESLILRRREEALLDEAKMQAYQELITLLPDPVLIIRDARVALANPAALNLLGDHIIDEDVRVAIRHPSAAERLANSNIQHTGEPTLLIGVGSPNQRWELRITQLEEQLKLVILSDQNSLYAADKMRTDFVANASHELRTPLTAIKGFIETLGNPEADSDPETRSRFLKIMYEEADRMQRLVEDLMSLSRIEAARYQLPEDAVNLTALTKEVQGFFLDSREKEAQDFKTNIPEDLPLVQGDHAQLSQLLHNLISNSFKYGSQSSPIEVSISPNPSGTMVKLAVSDKGEGIKPRHLPRLTERFYRVDKGRSKAIGGTGLGLSIVKHIAERHGGRMDIASEVGMGTTVTISLPTIKSQD